MKMKIIFLIFLTLLFFQSNCFGIKFMNNQYVPAEYVVIAQQIRTDVAAKLSKRYNMQVIGVTGGLADCVNVLGLSFQIRGPLIKEELRRILVDCVEEFLIPINTNERLRPFLKNYPFTSKEIEIEIFIVDDTGRRVYDPEIMLAAEYHGIVEYRTADKNTEFGYKQEMEEDYQTALSIVRKEQQK